MLQWASDFAVGQLPSRACRRSQSAAATAPPAPCRRRWCAASTCQQTDAAGHQPAQAVDPRRRSLLLGGLLLAGAAALPTPATLAAGAEPSSSSTAGEELVEFADPAQGYTLLRPVAWEQVSKAGADSLFRDPEKKSTNVGVTVLPVQIERLEQFGDLQAVGERLLRAEKEKESTLSAAMVSQSARTDPAGGFTIYDFEYELDSTRGRKRILSTVAIANRKLYIANGNVSCGKAPSCEAVEAALPLVRSTTQSIQIKS